MYTNTSDTASVTITDCFCDLGYSSLEDGVACVACAKGEFKNFTGIGNCTECPRGQPKTAFEASTNFTDCRSSDVEEEWYEEPAIMAPVSVGSFGLILFSLMFFLKSSNSEEENPVAAV
jgi:hypothetical protein